MLWLVDLHCCFPELSLTDISVSIFVDFWCCFQMAPKRQRVSSAEAGSSRSLPFDGDRFRGPAQEARYKELEERNIWTERTIRLREQGHYHTPFVVLED